MSCLSLTIALAAVALATPRYEGSDAWEDDRQAGLRPLREVAADLDGDGLAEVAVALIDAKGQAFVKLFRPEDDDDDADLELVLTGSSRRADRLLRLEVRPLLPRGRPAVVAVFEELAPDETLQHVRVFGLGPTGLAQVFAQSFHLASRSPPNAVAFGDASPRVTVEDVDDEKGGTPELVWVRGPQILELAGRDSVVPLIIGAERTVFRYDSAKGEFRQERGDDFEDFLVPKTPWEVEASQQAPKIWGTAQAFWGADGDLDTSWNVAGRKGGRGESLTVRFRRSEDISFVRVIPGCAANADDWEIHDTVRAFRIELSNGRSFEVDLRKVNALDKGVRAIGKFPLAGDFGSQVLVLLDGEPQPVRWGRLVITKVERSRATRARRVGETCVSEVSFH